MNKDDTGRPLSPGDEGYDEIAERMGLCEGQSIHSVKLVGVPNGAE